MGVLKFCIVFGVKDVADRYLPLGEFYLRDIELEEAKSIFKRIPQTSKGDFVFRLSKRYYDKQAQLDVNYEKSEFTIETDESGFHTVFDSLIKLQEEALED